MSHMVDLTQQLFDVRLKQWQREYLKERIANFINRKRGSWEMYNDGLLPILKSHYADIPSDVQDIERKLMEMKPKTSDYRSDIQENIRGTLQIIIESWIKIKEKEVHDIPDLEVNFLKFVICNHNLDI